MNEWTKKRIDGKLVHFMQQEALKVGVMPRGKGAEELLALASTNKDSTFYAACIDVVEFRKLA